MFSEPCTSLIQQRGGEQLHVARMAQIDGEIEHMAMALGIDLRQPVRAKLGEVSRIPSFLPSLV